MDLQKLEFEAVAQGLKPFLHDLSLSRLAARREALMASAPHLWGLSIWVNGKDFVFIDSKGYVCCTQNTELVLSLCLFESTQGIGALRALLDRPVHDPHFAIEYLAAKVFERKVAARSTEQPKVKNRQLTTSAFRALLQEI